MGLNFQFLKQISEFHRSSFNLVQQPEASESKQSPEQSRIHQEWHKVEPGRDLLASVQIGSSVTHSFFKNPNQDKENKAKQNILYLILEEREKRLHLYKKEKVGEMWFRKHL